MDSSSKIGIVSRLLIWGRFHKRQMWLAMLLLLLLSSASLLCGKFTGDLGMMFPDGSISGKMLSISKKSGLQEMMQIEFDCGAPGAAVEFKPQIASFVEKLRAHPAVARVEFNLEIELSTADIPNAFPWLVDASALNNVDCDEAAASILRAMLMPGTPTALLRSDPFGWTGGLLSHLSDFQKLAGANYSMENDFITDKQARFALVMAQATTQHGLLDDVRRMAEEYVPSAKATIVSPLVHSEENERVVRRDILVVSLLSAFALILLFIFLYHGAYDAILIPILPFLATLIVTGAMCILFKEVSLIVLGIGGGISGLAVDQGIHVYAAFTGKGAIGRLAELFKPLAMSVLTSVAVFASLCFSGIPACIQLGIFASGILLLNALLSYFLLPTLLKRKERIEMPIAECVPGKKLGGILLLLWLVVCAFGICRNIPQVNFNLNAMDGMPQDLQNSEAAFQARWMPGNSTMGVVVSDTQDSVLEECHRLEGILPDGSFVPSQLWPPMSARQERLKQWQSAETQEKLRQLEQKLASSCEKAGLPQHFFSPFFDAVKKGIVNDIPMQMPAMFRSILERTVRTTPEGVSALLFVPSGTDLQTTDTFTLLSGNCFANAALADFSPVIMRVGIVAAIALVLLFLAIPEYHSVRSIAVILLPGTTSLLCCCALANACGYRATLVTFMATLMLTGLVIDYGIFALQRMNGRSESVSGAMFLSAVTTLLTTGAMLFSAHPVIFHAGLVLFCGILFTSITALYIVPVLVNVSKSFKVISVLICIFMLSGCATMPMRQITGAQAKNEWYDFLSTQSETKLYYFQADILWYSVPTLLAVKADGDTGEINANVMTTTGITMLTVHAITGEEPEVKFADAIPESARKRIFGNIAEDLRHIFIHPKNIPFGFSVPQPFKCKAGENELIILDGSPLRLVQKSSDSWLFTDWKVLYYNYSQEKKAFSSIIYKSHNCTFTLKTVE